MSKNIDNTIQSFGPFSQSTAGLSLPIFENGKEKGGISYSTLKHEMTVTTDSVMNEKALVHKDFSIDSGNSKELQREVSRIGVDEQFLFREGKGNKSHIIGNIQDITIEDIEKIIDQTVPT